ncbi:SSI family serine proteinase inhibitor [Streptomyces hesseae]|uniref:SSI family serine proteinase inhibitor n=1 Tax=Streptomyces hesseae TaxID=3075519 RepID=A0ABU2SR67_9ACTN|nr:SSI family serine proteinase inhibitor [Streptomyces sp. DSM 40473]MDT0451141.1 SSI family serine proteinase inhibitor [Streptomyces sp. DSM 40473]
MSVRTIAAAAATITATATALFALPPDPASADTPGTKETGQLLLTISGARNTWIRGLRLVCPGAGGHHPHAAEACADLERAGGRPDALPGDTGRVCTREDDPVVATADGAWHGTTVAWRRTYPNLCLLEAATGAVFQF